MKIGELARRAGVSSKTIRFWDDLGLLAKVSRTAAGYRDFDTHTVNRLEFIRHAQAAGLTLAEIRQVLDIGDSGDAPCQHVRSLIDQRLAEVEARVAELQATQAHLRVLARRAAKQDPANCAGFCSIIVARGHPA